MPADPVYGWLDELRRRLRYDPLLAGRVLREVADHLAESAAEEERAGAPPDEARRRAVARFGSPAEFVHQLALGDMALRTASLLGASGSLAVGVFIAMVVVFLLPIANADQIPFWTLTSLGFLAYGTLTWVYFLSSMRSGLRFVLGGHGAGLLGYLYRSRRDGMALPR